MSIGPPFGVWALVEYLCNTGVSINSLISVPTGFPRPVQGFLGTESEICPGPLADRAFNASRRSTPRACMNDAVAYTMNIKGFCASCADPLD